MVLDATTLSNVSFLKELMFGTTERQDKVDDDENDDVDDASRYLRKWTNFNCPLNFLKA